MEWLVNTTLRPLYPRKWEPVLVVQEARWPTVPVWKGTLHFAPTLLGTADRPARIESLYRLSYPGRQPTHYVSHFFSVALRPTRVMASSFLRFLDHTQRRTTVGRTPLDEWSARRRDLYLTAHNTHNRQTSMSPVGFEPTISAGERPQTYALDRAATGTGITWAINTYKLEVHKWMGLSYTLEYEFQGLN